MEIKHIKDCWSLIKAAKTTYEIYKLFDQFPRWSGDWDLVVEDEHYVVYNTYFDEQYDSFETEFEILDIEVEE